MAEVRLCACGCGTPTLPASRTDRRYGQVKGEPLAYLPGHNPQGRGANLRKDSPQRAADEAKIRSHRHPDAVGPSPPPETELAEPTVNPDLPSKLEREKGVLAWRELRRQFWERPLVVADGTFVARALPPEYILPWESEDDVYERELPDYRLLGWRLEDSEIGLLLIGPNRLPQLVERADVLQPFDEDPPAAAESKSSVEVEVSIVEVDGVVSVGATVGDDPPPGVETEH
jgi:hypothetical protein